MRVNVYTSQHMPFDVPKEFQSSSCPFLYPMTSPISFKIPKLVNGSSYKVVPNSC